MSTWDFGHSFKNFDKYFVGFDKFFEKTSKFVDDSVKLATSYPPYNIRKDGENKYVLELAVAGFSKQDLEIELDGDTLIIKGNGESDDEKNDFLFQGIAARAFTRTFKIADSVEIKNAGLANGILRIVFDAIIPEHNKVKVEIADGTEK